MEQGKESNIVSLNVLQQQALSSIFESLTELITKRDKIVRIILEEFGFSPNDKIEIIDLKQGLVKLIKANINSPQ